MKKGYELVLVIYELTKDYPDSEKFSLVSQLRRAANSIVANIAESQGRFSYKDKIRVLYQARGEIFEVRSFLKVSEGLKYISSNEFNKIDKDFEGLLIGLNKYIDYLSKQAT
ncbi:four helix bundle protein [Patescibacteria group bacterium]|nr:four helix bundle protein [Patescibacteria group bacterium]